MKYDKLVELNDEEFRRLTGVKRATFARMLEILQEEEKKKKAKGGKPNYLSMEDRVLMTLEYIREYRTYFHIASSYGVRESVCYRNIKWIEECLVKHQEFALPGRKALLKSDKEYETILIDATESPIERPKRGKDVSTLERKRGIL